MKKDIDNKRPQKEKNSWLGGLTKFWKPSNDGNVSFIIHLKLFYVY